jgi:glycosyl transferase family 25
MNRLITYVINLDRATDRLQRISAQLEKLSIAFERLPAVDARALTPEQQKALNIEQFRRKHGMEPVLGELGCYLSHYILMQRFLDSTAEFALVLEDDALISERLPVALHGLMANAERWDMVKLSSIHSGTPQRVLEVAPGMHLAVMLSRCTASSAYIVNRKAASAYLQGLLPMSLPVDHVIDQGWTFGIKVRLLTPTPCGHDEAIASTIAAPAGTSRKFHWTKRLTTYRYRLGNELRRLRYGISQLISEKTRPG